MSFDGSGIYTVPAGTQAISGAVIDSTKYNALLTDLQTALTKCLLRDGQSASLANISMGGFKITSLAPGVLRTDAATLGQVQDGGSGLLTSVSGSNTITASCVTPQLAAYVTGLRLTLIPVADSTTAVTLNVNGLGTKAVLIGTTPMGVAGLRTGVAYSLVYDGAAFQLTSALVTGYAASGANADITSLSALTSPVSEVRQLQPITAAIAANAITVTPSALSLEFRNTTLTNGAVSFVEGTPAALVIAATDSFGLVTAAGNQRIVILAINNAGTIELAASALVGGVSLDETGVITTAIAATLSTQIKAANVRTGVAYRVIGFVDATFITATGWDSLVKVQGTGGQALAAMSSLGYGQTWKDVTGSRANGTTYYNTTGKPIQVQVYWRRGVNTNGYITLNSVVNDVTIDAQRHFFNTTDESVNTPCFVVPPGGSYSVAQSGLPSAMSWSELRP